MSEYRTVASDQGSVVHAAPVVPESDPGFYRVTVCHPKGNRRSWYENCAGPVSCLKCLRGMS
jgi:hypothetical protein